MKKQVLFLATTLMIIAASTTSCNRNCKGGGWYGDRNLGFVPVKKQHSDTQMKLEDLEENCNTVEP